jgi:hypothetical protein
MTELAPPPPPPHPATVSAKAATMIAALRIVD